MRRLRWFLAPFAPVAVAVALACGGGDDSSNTGAANNGGADGPTGGGSTTSQVLDLTRAAQELQAVDSFRFDMTFSMDFDLPEGSQDDELSAALLSMFSDFGAEGAYVGPDSYEFSMNLFGEELRMVQIGDEAWIYQGGQWSATTPETMGDFGFGMGGSPAELPFEFLPEEVLSGAEITSDNVNGVDATRYSFTKDSLLELARQFGEDVDMAQMDEIDTLSLDVWLTEDYFPVKMTMNLHGESEGSAFGMMLDFNITNINDDGITIERPI